MLSGILSPLGRNSIRGSGNAGATPVAIPAGAPPEPVPVPVAAPGAADGGATGGNVVGVTVGAKIGAGGGAFFAGFRLSADPSPTALGTPRAAGRTSTYWIRSVGAVRSRVKSAPIGYRNVIEAMSAITTACTATDRAIDSFDVGR